MLNRNQHPAKINGDLLDQFYLFAQQYHLEDLIDAQHITTGARPNYLTISRPSTTAILTAL